LDQVGRYQILEELGRGAHGVVYKALDPAIGRTIAIKAIALGNINQADRERVREGILREARLAGTLSHPNIVTVYDVLDDNDSAYIFMEFVDGKSLEDAISSTKENRPGKLSRAGFISIFKQVAQALDYAHRKGVIHRDIKPANIVLTHGRVGKEPASDEEVRAKIADFGVAKFASQEVTQQLGGQRALIGTPSYMSPEQVQGRAVSGASDQFSLAVIVYEVLCGRKAFEADTIEAVLYRIRNEREAPVNSLNPALSPTVNKVMERALAKEPDQRFGTCSEFAGALEFALGDSGKWEPGVIGATALSAAAPSRGEASANNPGQAMVLYTTPDEEMGWGKRLALLAALCLAVGLSVVLIVRMNSGPAIATQVLDTRSGAVTPPPTVQELKYEPHVPVPRLQLGPVQSGPGNPPVTVKIPAPVPTPAQAPVPAPKRKLLPVRLSKPVVTSAEVNFGSDPLGANVMVDGMNSCLAPCSITLANGRHTLAATLDGYTTARKIFSVPADASVFLEMARSVGVLLVSSEPPGASVNVDGSMAGTTPLTLRLSPGLHQVSVWDGRRWHGQSVLITADAVHTRLFRF
jgi:tRNA A-37 threonylcarbamoyl transferase component Bud32